MFEAMKQVTARMKNTMHPTEIPNPTLQKLESKRQPLSEAKYREWQTPLLQLLWDP